MTIQECKDKIRALGLTVRVTDGEWRVAFPIPAYQAMGLDHKTAMVRNEAEAAYSDDGEDALGMARAMAKQGPHDGKAPAMDPAFTLSDLEFEYLKARAEWNVALLAQVSMREVAEVRNDAVVQLINSGESAARAIQVGATLDTIRDGVRRWVVA